MENIPTDKENQIETKDTADPIKAIETLERSLEISPTMDNNIALCVIKPDAFSNRDSIVKRLEDSGLYVVRRTVRNLSEAFVINEMYGSDKLPKPIADATARHFTGGPSEIVLVRGDNVVQRLLQSVGLKTNPALCDNDSIRYIYGDHIPEELSDGLKYFRNAAHRPTNFREAESDLKKFNNLI